MDVNKVYKSQLLRNYWHLGLPLRNGRPVQSGPHTQEVLIGDVGWQSRQDSSFHVLFNAIEPAFHPDLSPPETYEPFPISPSRTPAKWRMLHHVDAAVLPAGPIRSTSITRVEFQASASTPGSPVSAELHVTCSKDRGALLVLHHPADHAHLEPCREVKAYVLRHYQSWYDHAASLGLDLEMGEIVFVTAWYKTSKWDTFTFTSKSHDVQLSLQGTAPVAADLSLGMSVSSGTFSDVHQLYGPAASSAMSPRGRVFSSLYVNAPTAGGSAVYADSDAYISGDLLSGDRTMSAPNQRNLAGSSSEQEASPALNQCLFIQGYIPYKRRLFPPYLKAAAGFHDLGGHEPDPSSVSPIIAGSQSESDSDSSVEYLVEPPRAYDPLVETLQYILEKNPTVEAVVGHHQDLTVLFSSFDTSDDWPEDIQIRLEQLPKSTVRTLTQNVLDHGGIIEALAAAGVSPPSPRTGSSLLGYDARQREKVVGTLHEKHEKRLSAFYYEMDARSLGIASSVFGSAMGRGAGKQKIPDPPESWIPFRAGNTSYGYDPLQQGKQGRPHTSMGLSNYPAPTPSPLYAGYYGHALTPRELGRSQRYVTPGASLPVTDSAAASRYDFGVSRQPEGQQGYAQDNTYSPSYLALPGFKFPQDASFSDPVKENAIMKHAVASPATLAAAQNRGKTNVNFLCELCGSSFTRESNLKSHMNSHYGERPHACQYCERAFNRAHDCRRHEQTCEYRPSGSSRPRLAGYDGAGQVARGASEGK